MVIAFWGWALIAAIVWGVHYTLLGRAMTQLNPITMYWLPTIPLTLGLPFYYHILVEDYHKLMAAGSDIKISAGVVMCTSILASIAVYKSIQGSNATSASLIEITFPVFVAIFAYLIWGENHITSWHFIVGGLLILSGSALIIYGSQFS